MEYRPTVQPRGPTNARILIVGEAPGEHEVNAGLPFVGPSGYELSKMLSEARIPEAECRFTNVMNIRPRNNKFDKEWMATSLKKAKEKGYIYHAGQYIDPIVLEGLRELQREIETVQPNVIVPLGNVALWATTGNWGIGKWRRSEIPARINDRTWKVIPTYHPAFILRTWEARPIAVQDFRVIYREKDHPDVIRPDYDFLVRPSFPDTMDYLRDLGARGCKIACDVETRNRQIACIGLARSHLHAICIPIQSVDSPTGSYWTVDEEAAIMWEVMNLLRKAHVIGQNFHYDNQYFARNYGFLVNLRDDTIFRQHVAFPGLPKGLDFLSSMYCEHHLYWKEDGKLWNPKTTHEEQLWVYNCTDAVKTYECDGVLEKIVTGFGLIPQYRERLRTQRNALTMMLRGTRSDISAKLELSSELAQGIAHMRHWWDRVVGYDIFGPKGISSAKMMKFAYDILKLPLKYKGRGEDRKLTADKEACQEWEETCEPIFRPLLAFVRHYRSMGVFKSTFADQALDDDQRWRCTNNAGLANTFRWTTSEDAFGFGTNLQNIPKGDKR